MFIPFLSYYLLRKNQAYILKKYLNVLIQNQLFDTAEPSFPCLILQNQNCLHLYNFLIDIYINI